MAEVLEINRLDQLEHYRMVWDSLLPTTPRASFFHTFDWLTTYWRHFGQDQRLRVLVVTNIVRGMTVDTDRRDHQPLVIQSDTVDRL